MTSAFMGPQRFDMSRVIERTFGAISANAATLLLAALLFAGVPTAILNLISAGWVAEGNWVGAFFAGLIGMVVSLVCGILLQGVVTHTVVTDLLGRKATLSDSMDAAMRSFWMLLAVGIVSGIAIAIGAVFLLIPGIFLALIWFVVGPVVVAERADFGQAFSRSMKLTENHRWVILGLIVIYVIASWVLMIPVGIIAAIAGGGLGSVSPIATIVSAVFQALFSLIGAAGVAAVYVELRTVKEGGGRESVAAIFE